MTPDQDAVSIIARIQANAVGHVPGHWQVTKLGQLIDEGVVEKIQDGNHGESHPVESDYVPSGIPFVMSGAIRDGKVDLQQCKYLSQDHARSLRVGHARKGDVLLTHKGNQLGRVAILDNADWAVLTPQVTYYRIAKQDVLDSHFLQYYFQSPTFQYQFTRDAEQSTRPFVSISAQRNLFVVIPPIAEQRAIAHVLLAMDEKNESNRQMNRTLVALATNNATNAAGSVCWT
jgi:type I restriction enzyme S subunit